MLHPLLSLGKLNLHGDDTIVDLSIVVRSIYSCKGASTWPMMFGVMRAGTARAGSNSWSWLDSKGQRSLGERSVTVGS
jgi:hypothetical protein